MLQSWVYWESSCNREPRNEAHGMKSSEHMANEVTSREALLAGSILDRYQSETNPPFLEAQMPTSCGQCQSGINNDAVEEPAPPPTSCGQCQSGDNAPKKANSRSGKASSWMNLPRA